MANVIDIDANSPVWRVIKGRCRTCGAVAISVQHMDCPKDDNECPACHQFRFCVTHYELSGELCPRLEALN